MWHTTEQRALDHIFQTNEPAPAVILAKDRSRAIAIRDWPCEATTQAALSMTPPRITQMAAAEMRNEAAFFAFAFCLLYMRRSGIAIRVD